MFYKNKDYMVKKIEKSLYRISLLVQFETLSWFKPATLLKITKVQK